ncbi:unnamed protein product [Allacma fusca]|uniref:Uncharacterized protein n=1 Tax=Allacma fusca TaxID=39272 RepID=A0A8J2KTD4_9HEXA|nr:unnamed protein product [Allacma fusca]
MRLGCIRPGSLVLRNRRPRKRSQLVLHCKLKGPQSHPVIKEITITFYRYSGVSTTLAIAGANHGFEYFILPIKFLAPVISNYRDCGIHKRSGRGPTFFRRSPATNETFRININVRFENRQRV